MQNKELSKDSFEMFGCLIEEQHNPNYLNPIAGVAYRPDSHLIASVSRWSNEVVDDIEGHNIGVLLIVGKHG